MISDEAHQATVQALTAAHREEVMAARALNVVYRALLDAAGLPLPADEDGAEALRRIRAVFLNAGLHGDPLQAHDLTDDWSGIFTARPPDPASHDPLVRAWR